jgi:uncharacterized protein (TIGR03382 family)
MLGCGAAAIPNPLLLLLLLLLLLVLVVTVLLLVGWLVMLQQRQGQQGWRIAGSSWQHAC